MLSSAALTPILLIFDLNGTLLTPYKSFKIVMSVLNSQVVKHCSNDRINATYFYMYLENPSTIFRFINTTNIGDTFVLKETTGANSYISNISTQ